MPEPQTSNWIPPVEFYFRVDFQSLKQDPFQASFTEVSGIGWNFTAKEKKANANGNQKLPESISYSNITLKRPVNTMNDPFSSWVNSYLKSMFKSKNSEKVHKIPCNIIIKLLNENGEPLMSWTCYHAYPIKYDISSLNAEKSGLVMETVTLAYARLERVN